MWTGYVGEVFDASGHTGTVDTVHIREQTQIERDLIEDGVEGGRSLADGAGQVPGTCDQHLHEARGIAMWMFLQYIKDMWTDITPWIYAVIIVTVLVLVLGMAI